MANKFAKIELHEWQQFERIEIELHDRVTILTGANGSGKTTILNLLGRHCGWGRASLSIPKRTENGLYGWAISLLNSWRKDDNILAGEIAYTNGNKANLQLPGSVGVSYNLNIDGQQSVDSFFVPSHRSVFSYRQIQNIPTNPTQLSKAQAFQRVSKVNMERYNGGGSNQTANFHIKEILIAWGAFGEGNNSLQSIPEFKKSFDGFEEILRIILPKNLGFRKIGIENFEVVLKCDAGDFILDGASGGLTALIDLAWQIYMYAETSDKEFTVIIDEVENHLHPIMQRRILPDLVQAFPRVSFIVSTHSPLIVNSMQNSNVYALRYSDNKRIVSQKLDFYEQAKTASEILDEVLGVSFTMPIWAEEKIDLLIASLDMKNIQAEDLVSLRNKLKELGLDKFFPSTIEKLILNKETHEKNSTSDVPKSFKTGWKL